MESPITPKGVMDVVKGAASMIAALTIIGTAWITLGGPVPVSQLAMDEAVGVIESTIQDLDSRVITIENFAKETRIMSLLIQRNTAYDRLARAEDRYHDNDADPELADDHMKSLKREISSLEAEIKRLGGGEAIRNPWREIIQ